MANTFDPVWTSLHKNASLILPYSEILSVTLADELPDTIITIRTVNDGIRLATRQKALSDLRMSGSNVTRFTGGYKNWHKENLGGDTESADPVRRRCWELTKDTVLF